MEKDVCTFSEDLSSNKSLWTSLQAAINPDMSRFFTDGDELRHKQLIIKGLIKDLQPDKGSLHVNKDINNASSP